MRRREAQPGLRFTRQAYHTNMWGKVEHRVLSNPWLGRPELLYRESAEVSRGSPQKIQASPKNFGARGIPASPKGKPKLLANLSS